MRKRGSTTRITGPNDQPITCEVGARYYKRSVGSIGIRNGLQLVTTLSANGADYKSLGQRPRKHSGENYASAEGAELFPKCRSILSVAYAALSGLSSLGLTLTQGWRASRLPLATLCHAFSMKKIKCGGSL